MSVTTISIQLDEPAAAVYRHAPVERREWLRMLINSLVQGYAHYSPQSLLAVMDEISQEAKANGLTPEILETLLADE